MERAGTCASYGWAILFSEARRDLHKSRKRFEDGPPDDFVAYYSVIAESEADG